MLATTVRGGRLVVKQLIHSGLAEGELNDVDVTLRPLLLVYVVGSLTSNGVLSP